MRPGLRRLSGSKASFRARMAESSSEVLASLSSCVLRLPTPCSAAIEPPSASHAVVHEPVDGFLRCKGNAGGADVEVQIAVAVVSEDRGLHAGKGRPQGVARFPDEAGEARARHADVVLDVAALALDGGGNGLAAAPERFAVRFASADGAVEKQPRLEQRREHAFERFGRCVGISEPVGDVKENLPVRNRDGRPQARDAGERGERRAADELKRRESRDRRPIRAFQRASRRRRDA